MLGPLCPASLNTMLFRIHLGGLLLGPWPHPLAGPLQAPEALLSASREETRGAPAPLQATSLAQSEDHVFVPLYPDGPWRGAGPALSGDTCVPCGGACPAVTNRGVNCLLGSLGVWDKSWGFECPRFGGGRSQLIMGRVMPGKSPELL